VAFVLSGKNGQTITKIPVEKHAKWPHYGQTILSTDNSRFNHYREKDVWCCLGGCPRMPFYPNSSLLTENNARNIKHMTVLILCKCLGFE